VTEADVPNGAVRGTRHWIDTIESSGTGNAVDGLPGGNSEGNCGDQIKVAGYPANRVNVERELLHTCCESDGAATRSSIGQTVEHIRKSIVIDVRSKSAKAIDVCTAASFAKRRFIDSRSRNYQYGLECRGIGGPREQERYQQQSRCSFVEWQRHVASNSTSLS